MVVILGSTGFVASHLVLPLLCEIYPEKLRCAVRSSRDESFFRSISVEPVRADVRNSEQLNRALSGARTVINLVTITTEKCSGDFEQTHFQGMANLVRAAQSHGVERIIHIGALARPSDRFDKGKPYIYWKQMATEFLQTTDLDYAIFETSIIFGEGDRLISLVALAIKYLPFLPLAGVRAAETKFQPIYVKDVVAFVLAALRTPTLIRRVFPLGGPQVYPFIELIHLVSRELGKKKRIVMIRNSQVRRFCQAATYLFPHWPLPPDFLDLAGVDSIAESTATYDYFNIQPKPPTDCINYVRKVGWLNAAKWVRGSPFLPYPDIFAPRANIHGASSLHDS